MNLRDCLIRYGIVDSPRLCRLPVPVQLFFRNILHAGDGAGRFKVDYDDLRTTFYRHALDRVTKRHVTSWMAQCHTAGLVRLYTGPEGAGYCELLKYGQRDSKRRVLHPGPHDESLNFEAAPADPPNGSRNEVAAPPELNRRELKSIPATAEPVTGGGEAFSDSDQAISEPFDANADLGNRSRAEVEQALFFALCAAEGSDPQKLTAAGKASITRALTSIRRATRGLTPDMIARAVAAYRKKFPTLDLTANALNKHWARLDTKDTAAATLIEPEPLGWRNWINENTPDVPFARGGDREGTQWTDLDASYRRYLIGKVTHRPAA